MTATKNDGEIQHFRLDVMEGLNQEQKAIPCKYFYDLRGSRLFDRICDLDAYYPTRTEMEIMEQNIDHIVEVIGPRCMLIEYGSGSSLKTRWLLDHLVDPAAYVPVDISTEHLQETVEQLRLVYPNIEILPVAADFTKPFDVPRTDNPIGQRVVYFPGSTIGNFAPEDAVRLLKVMAGEFEDGGLLIGVDLKKDRRILERAYDDEEGVTAAFNKNILRRMNRELGSDFDEDRFRHKAVYNPNLGRVEIYLVSLEEQVVTLGDEHIPFEENETIHTENSHKFSLEDFKSIAATAGLQVDHVWTDENALFSVQFLSAV